MVTIRNREMIIPQVERRIGVVSDNNSEMRTFSIPRFIANSIDLSALTFKLDLENENGDTNTAHLSKEVLEDRINLTWTIIANDVSVSGTLLASIRATDGSGTVKWGSYKGAFYVESGINTPERFSGNLSELESMEHAIDDVLSSETARQAAESIRKSNEEKRITLAEQMQRATTGVTEGEQARITAENDRRTAETIRVNQENSRKSAETTRTTAETERVTAESTRVAAEAGRVTAEIERVNQENGRVVAETARVTAEGERVILAAHMESATGRANAAAQTCEGLVEGIIPVANPEKIGGVLSAGDIQVNADGSVTIPSLTTLQALIDDRIQKSMIAHVLNSANANMVLGADQGPQITSLIDAQKLRIDQVNSNLSNFYTKTIDRNDYATAAEFENAVDHPQIMFGKSDPFSYKLILSNNKGDTVYSGGISTIWGYCNGVDGSGNQIFMKFTGLLKHRSRNTPAAWSAWTDIITNSDLKITNATIDMGRDNTGVYMQINGINNISFLLRFDVANKALITDTMVDGVWLGKKTIASWTK